MSTTALKYKLVLHPAHSASQQQHQNQLPETEAYNNILRLTDTDTETPTWCPMCMVNMRITSLCDFYKRWKEVGGPWDAVKRDSPAKLLANAAAKRVYYMCKTHLANQVLKMEDMAKVEIEWEIAHASVTSTRSAEAMRMYSATRAVEAHARSIRFPGMMPDTQPIPPLASLLSLPLESQEKKEKKVAFAPDVPDGTRNRPNAFFRRRHASYDPKSPHACPIANGWAETSFQHDLEYNLRQCRLLLCDGNVRLQQDVKYRELHDDASKNVLVAAVKEWLGSLEIETEKQYWTGNLTDTTDIFTVWKEGDGDEAFSSWERLVTLQGSSLDAHARGN